MMDDQKYWNPVLETMRFEKLFELQLFKFKRILEWALSSSDEGQAGDCAAGADVAAVTATFQLLEIVRGQGQPNIQAPGLHTLETRRGIKNFIELEPVQGVRRQDLAPDLRRDPALA